MNENLPGVTLSNDAFRGPETQTSRHLGFLGFQDKKVE
jgi:hypothetical protein